MKWRLALSLAWALVLLSSAHGSTHSRSTSPSPSGVPSSSVSAPMREAVFDIKKLNALLKGGGDSEFPSNTKSDGTQSSSSSASSYSSSSSSSSSTSSSSSSSSAALGSPDWSIRFYKPDPTCNQHEDLDEKDEHEAETVLILTPMKDTVHHLEQYFQLLASLDYPSRLISLGILEGGSSDGTFEQLKARLPKLVDKYRQVTLIQKDFEDPALNLTRKNRHEYEKQQGRRAIIAKARNFLLFSALRQEKWVLWLDGDMRYVQPDIIEKLIATGKEVVTVPVFDGNDKKFQDPYDLNTWVESKYAQALESKLADSVPTFEGYFKHPTWHTYLKRNLILGKHLVPVDSVGGCVLLVRADVHRQGLVFPTFVLRHGIETEGLAKMAKEMGYQPYALVDVDAFHGAWNQ